MKSDNQRLKHLGTLLMVIGVGIWLIAVLVANEPSKIFLGTVYVGWALALGGALLHVVAFFNSKER